MAISLRITGVKPVENGWEIGYTVNGHRKGIVFGSKAQAGEWLDEHQFTEEDLLALALRTWKANDPNLNNVGAVTNREFIVDLTNLPNIVRVPVV